MSYNTDFDIPNKNSAITVRALICSRILGRKILLLKRSDSQNLKGQEEPPGGRVKEGEDIKVALQREIREECGFSVNVERLHYLNTIQYTNSAGIKKYEHFFYVISSEREVTISLNEHKSFRWLDINQLSQAKMHPAVFDLIAKNIDFINWLEG